MLRGSSEAALPDSCLRKRLKGPSPSLIHICSLTSARPSLQNHQRGSLGLLITAPCTSSKALDVRPLLENTGVRLRKSLATAQAFAGSGPVTDLRQHTAGQRSWVCINSTKGESQAQTHPCEPVRHHNHSLRLRLSPELPRA